MLLSWDAVIPGWSWGWGEIQMRVCFEGKKLQKCMLIEGCRQSVLPGTGPWTRPVGPMTRSFRMPLFQGPHTEAGLASTAAAGEAEVAVSTAAGAEVIVSTAGEVEASSVPTGGPALSMSTQDPGKGVSSVSSLECTLHFTSFWEMVGISGGSSHWPSSSVCKTHSYSLVGPGSSRQ